MDGTLKSLKLQHNFDFREIYIEYDNTVGSIRSIHKILKEQVMPAIIEMESAINSFHFIRHATLDLRLSSLFWPYCEDQITEILAKHGLPIKMRPWKLGKPENHGGEMGELLTYNVLGHNSRAILALITVEGTDILALNICVHWPHYLYLQYGFNHIQQARLNFDSAMTWVETALANDPWHPECVDICSYICSGTTELSKKCLQAWEESE
jgi:hypothetical protein